jgi:DNA-binding transcriptional LysR family regulator
MNVPPKHVRRSIGKFRVPSGTEPNVDLVSISQALVVADHLSFTRAAHVLGVKQSAVSRGVQALENQLGVSLFERHMNGVLVTLAGRLFLDRMRSALTDIDHAVQSAGAAGRGAEGVVRVGILPSMLSGFFGDLLRDFRTAHPGVAMDFFEGSALEQIARITQRRLDVAFVIEGYDVPSCDVERL